MSYHNLNFGFFLFGLIEFFFVAFLYKKLFCLASPFYIILLIVEFHNFIQFDFDEVTLGLRSSRIFEGLL
jgi:hypothetical protein